MKEKILFLTAYVPNKAAAGEKNTMIMLNDLASCYDVDLIYFKYDWENDYVPERGNVNTKLTIRNSIMTKLKNVCNFPFVHPTFSIRFNWLILRRVRDLLKINHYKVVIFNHSNMFLYGRYIDKRIPKILLCHDVIAQRVLRSSSYLMQKICIFSERMSLNLPNAHIFSFSQKDCDLIKQIYHKETNLCLDYIDEQIINKSPDKVEDYFTMFGDWRRKENAEGALWFINTVGPLLRKKVHIKIIGRGFPNKDVKNIVPNLNLDILGFVDDPYKILSQSKALISPLFTGAGIKVKVIEALACGIPVIGTDIAFEGLPPLFNSFMLIAETPKDYIRCMECLNMNIDERIKTKEQYKGILLMIKQVMNWIKTHRYCLAGLYMLVFLSGFFLLELHEPSDVHIIHCAVDDLIPFNEWFVLPYFLWYAWVPVFMIYFMIKDREAYLRLCFVMFSGATFCLFVYLLAPNGLNLRQEITSQNFCAQIVRFLRRVDPPNNVCPSIHVSSTVAVHLTICHAASVRNKKPIRTLSWIVTILICLSTMFIKQHSLVDVLCGWILSLILDEAVNVWVLVKAFSKGKMIALWKTNK